jgi:site-specific recombinase XerD
MKLLDRYEAACKVPHLARRTIQTYRRWVEKFLRFQHDRTGTWIHPEHMDQPEVEAFLTHLAVNRRVTPSTPNHALGPILFLYRHVLARPLRILDAVRAKKSLRLPTMMSKDEVRRLIAAMPEKGAHRLIVQLLYGGKWDDSLAIFLAASIRDNGVAENEDSPYGFRVATEVPEPSTGVLAILACGLMCWWSKRFK